jgi:ketosteroid isomerase-like protein
MSRENVETVRAIYDAWQRDYESAFDYFADDVEWYEPPDVSGGNVAYGPEAARRSLSRWIGMWSDYRYELRELIDAGDRVFAAGWQSGRGKGSGVETSEEIFSVWILRAGKAVEQRMFRDRTQALEAAGLSDQDTRADA